MAPPEAERGLPRGRFVEFVRLIFVVLFATGGYTVATRFPDPAVTARNVIKTATGRMVFASLQGDA